MKCANCGGTIGMVSDELCEFCEADMTYVELTYSEYA